MSTINFEKAIEYIKNLPTTPDSNLTPVVIIKWDKTKTFRTEYGGKIVEKSPVFYYPKTGKVEFLERAPANYKCDYLFDNLDDIRNPYTANEKVSVTTAKPEIFSYYGKYHKEIDAFEVASVVMKGNRAKDGERRTWEYTDINNGRYFLFRNGEAIKGFSYLQKDGKFYDKTLLHWLKTVIPQNIHNRYFDEQALVFFGFKATEEWLGRLVRYYVGGRYTSQEVGYKEKYRFFFNEKEEFILQKRNDKSGSCAANNCYQSCSAEHIINFNELRKVKRIDRCVDVLLNNEFLNKESFLVNLIYILKYPIVEKLGKAGYKYLMSKMIRSPTTLLRDKFDTTPKKTGTLYENLGMNKIQLKMLE